MYILYVQNQTFRFSSPITIQTQISLCFFQKLYVYLPMAGIYTVFTISEQAESFKSAPKAWF